MQNFFLSCKEIRIEPTTPKTHYGCFYLGPFENGQGLTVANALRRTLLSEISGLAITSVKVNNIFHEYSTLPGVKETVLDILLNLKEIVLNKNLTQPLLQTQIGYLQARGPGIVRACDLKLPPLIQAADPDQYIATLTENGYLNFKFKIDEGKNFIYQKSPFDFSASSTTHSERNNNFLSIDAVFTPIKKVNYTVESYGAESIEKANQIIILEIWTNGSISPKEAISQSLNYLRVLFNGLGKLKILQSILTSYSLKDNEKFRNIFQKIENDLDLFQFDFSTKKTYKPNLQKAFLNNIPSTIKQKTIEDFVKEIEEQTKKDWKHRNINDLGLPFRIFNSFYRANLQTVGQILEMDVKDLKQIPGFGQQSLLVLKEILKSKGLNLKNE